MNITIQTWLDKSKLVPMRQRLKETIKNKLVPINQLSQDNQKSVFKQARILIYSMGSYLFRKGDNDNFIYYLLEGKVELLAPDKKTVAVYGGTTRAMNQISGNYPREYSARAASVVKVLKIERQLLAFALPPGKHN